MLYREYICENIGNLNNDCDDTEEFIVRFDNNFVVV